MAPATSAADVWEQHALIPHAPAGPRWRPARRAAVGASALLALLSASAWASASRCAEGSCRSTSHGLEAVGLGSRADGPGGGRPGAARAADRLEAAVRLKQSARSTERVLGLEGGLGFGHCTGLVNQLLALLGAVMYAREHGIRYISEDTLKFHSGWDVEIGDVSFAELFNVTRWNERAMGNQSLPLPYIVRSSNVTHWIKARAYFQRAMERADVWTASRDPSVCWFWGSLRPVDALLKAVESAKPVGDYGVFHARIEDDLDTPGIPAVFRKDRLSLPTMYGMISNFSHPCVTRPDSFYMCVMASDVTVPEDASLLKRRLTPWDNLSLQLGGSEAARKAGLEGSKIQGALLDFEVARRGKFFIGEEGLSTFAMALATSRKCAGLQCNIHLGPDGIRVIGVDLKDIAI